MVNIIVEEPQEISPDGPKWKGPRNLPKKTGKVFRRWRQKQARKRNRGAYSGR